MGQLVPPEFARHARALELVQPPLVNEQSTPRHVRARARRFKYPSFRVFGAHRVRAHDPVDGVHLLDITHARVALEIFPTPQPAPAIP